MTSSGDAQDKLLGPLIRVKLEKRHQEMLAQQHLTEEEWGEMSDEIVRRSLAEHDPEELRELFEGGEERLRKLREQVSAGFIETYEESRARELEIWKHQLSEFGIKDKQGLRTHIQEMLPNYLDYVSEAEFEAALADICTNVLLADFKC